MVFVYSHTYGGSYDVVLGELITLREFESCDHSAVNQPYIDGSPAGTVSQGNQWNSDVRIRARIQVSPNPVRDSKHPVTGKHSVQRERGKMGCCAKHGVEPGEYSGSDSSWGRVDIGERDQDWVTTLSNPGLVTAVVQ